MNKNKFLVFVLILLTACLLIACTSEAVTVSFYVDGSLYGSYKVEKGKYLDDIPTVPAKDGYSGKWSVQDFDEINSDLRVDALYTKNTYSVTFMADGEVLEVVTSDTSKSISYIPDVPEKSGYIGVWNISEEDFSSVRTDTVVEAVYSVRPVSVVFYKNEFVYTPAVVVIGEAIPAKKYFVLTDEYRYTSDTVFRSGVTYYTRSRVKFTELTAKNGVLQGEVPSTPTVEGVSVKWMELNETATGEVFTEPDFSLINEDMTLVAYPYVVLTLNDGFTDTLFKKECDIGEAILSLSSVSTREGYEFYGWYYDDECLQKVEFPLSFTENKTLYAKWICLTATKGVLIDNGTVVGYKGTDTDIYIPSKYQYEEDGVQKTAYVTSIGENAFKNTKITGISLPATIENVGNSAFYGCSSLKSVTFPDGNYIQKYGTQAFRLCGNLTSFTFSAKTSEISSYAFAGCSALRTVNGLEKSSLTTLSKFCFQNCSALTYIQLPATLSAVGEEAFAEDILCEIEFDDASSLQKIGQYAFRNCRKFAGFISENLSEIGVSVFSGCSLLTSATVFGGYKLYQLFDTSIPEDVDKYYQVEGYYIPLSLQNVLLANPTDGIVQSKTFADCYSVKKFTFAGNVTVIDTSAFLLDKNSATNEECVIVFPDTLTEIKSNAFRGRNDIRELSFPSSLETIGAEAFYGLSSVSSVTLPGANVLSSVGKDAFAGTEWLDDYSGLITLGRMVLGISDSYCRRANVTQLTSDSFQGCTTIVPYAFADNQFLEKITLNPTIHTVGDYAFKNCLALQNFAFNPYTLSGDRTIGTTVLDGCNSLTTLTVCEDITLDELFTNGLPATLKNLALSYSGKNATVPADVYNKETIEKLTVGEGFTALAENAFVGMNALRNFEAVGIVTVGKKAFFECTALQSVTIKKGLSTIAESAFSGCSLLSAISFPNSLETIEKEAFLGTKIEEFNAPSSLKTIGERAFFGSSLIKAVLPEGLETIANYAFSDCALKSITIPKSVVLTEENSGKGWLCNNLLTDLVIGVSVKIDTLFDGNVPSCLAKVTVTAGEIVEEEFASLSVVNVTLKEVSAIGNKAFYGCASLKKIVIPASVQRIGDSAFENCSVMTSCEISANNGKLTEIGQAVFKNCPKITYAVFPNTVQTVNWTEMFYGCASLETTNVPSAVTEIGNDAYFGCEKIVSAGLHNHITKIGKNAFKNCTLLAFDLVEFDDLTEIGESAFENCQSIKNIRAEAVNKVGKNAYKGCIGIEEITICEQDVTEYAAETAATVSTVNIAKTVESVQSSCFDGCDSLTTVIIYSTSPTFPVSSVCEQVNNDVVIFVGADVYLSLSTEVQDKVYSKPSQVEFTFAVQGENAVLTGLAEGEVFEKNTVYLPDTATIEGKEYPVTAIGQQAFQGRTDISYVIIPATVTTIGSAAFAGCSMEKLVFESGSKLSVIHNNAFNNTNIRAISFPSTLVTIGDSAFAGCTALSSVYFPAGSLLTSIGSYAFSQTTSLHGFAITGAVETIGYAAFSDSALTSFSFGNKTKIVEIADELFENVSLQEIVLPETVQRIGKNALKGFVGTSITLPEGLLTIDEGAFQNAASLKSVDFPTTLVSVGKRAFYNNVALEKIMLPDSVVTVGEEAFAACSNVTEIRLGKNLTTLSTGAFSGTVAVKTLTVASERLQNFAENNSIFYNTGKDGSGIACVLQENVITLPDNLFYPSSSKVGIPSVKSVSFAGTPSVISIGKNAFRAGTLQEIILPASVLSIGEGAFADCSSLSIVSQTEREGKQWASGWKDATKTVEYARNKCTNGDFTYVAYGDNAYITDYTGSEKNVVVPAVLDGFTVVGTGIALENKDFLSVSLPNGVCTVGSFYGCDDLVGVTLGEETEEIPDYSFYGCSSLLYFVLPSTLTRLGQNVFDGCTSLATVYLESETVWQDCIDEEAFLTACETVYIDNTFAEGTFLQENGYAVLPIDKEGYTVYSKLYWKPTSKSAYAYLLNDWEPTDPVYNPDSVSEDRTIRNEYHLYVDGGAMAENVYGWASLKDTITVITVGEGTTSIGKSAFAGCENVKNVYFNAVSCADATQDKYYFSGTGKNGFAVVFGQNVSHVPAYLLSNSTYLNAIDWGNSAIISIGTSAFEGCTSIQNLVLPDALKTIGDFAFKSCSKIVTLTIGQNVNTFGQGCFADIGIDEDDFYLKTIYYNALSATDLTGNKDVFSSAIQYDAEESGAEIVFSGAVTYIPAYLFYGCKNISSLSFPSDSSLTGIGQNAFRGCVNLDNLSLPLLVSSIGKFAFYSCTSLSTVTIPSSGKITFLGEKAFSGTAYSADETQWKDNVLYLNGRFLLETRNGVAEDYTVVSDTDVIAEKAFETATNLKYITIPSSVDVINDDAFSSCTLLKTVFIKSKAVMEGLETAKSEGSLCANAHNVYYMAELYIEREIGSYISQTTYHMVETETLFNSVRYYSFTDLYWNCEKEGGTVYAYMLNCDDDIDKTTGKHNDKYRMEIKGKGAMKDFSDFGTASWKQYIDSVSQLNIGKEVTALGNYAFSGSTSLKEVNFADKNEFASIGAFSFFNCVSLEKITIQTGVTSIGRGAFSGCEGLTTIQYDATACADFAENNNVFLNVGSSTSGVKVTVGYKVEAIPAYLFCPATSEESCPSVTQIVFVGGSGNECKSIGKFAFAYCTELIEFTCESTKLHTIGEKAFYRCTTLSSVRIPSGVSEIGSRAYGDCFGLTQIVYSAEECKNMTAESLIFGDVGGESGITLTITDTVKTIPDYLFKDTEKINKVVFPSVDEEGKSSARLAKIGAYAFSGCVGITSLDLPDSLTEISPCALYKCVSLTDLVIPFVGTKASATTSSENTLLGVLFGTAQKDGDNFVEIDGMYICEQSLSDISTYSFYIPKTLQNITVLKYTNIYNGAFSSLSYSKTTMSGGQSQTAYYGVESITVRTSNILSVTDETGKNVSNGYYVGQYAFYQSRALKYVTLNDAVTTIGEKAFYACEKLSSITVPKNVSAIGKEAYYGCFDVENIYYNAIACENFSADDDVFGGVGKNKGMTAVTVGDDVVSLPSYLFSTSEATKISSVTCASENLLSIGDYAFYNCSYLSNISLPSSLISIGEGIVSGTEYYKSNSAWVGKVLYYKGDGYRYVLGYNQNKTEDVSTVINIEATTLLIAASAFKNGSVTSVTLPQSLMYIGKNAFMSANLTSVTLPSDSALKEIGQEAFKKCKKLSSFTVTKNLKSIGDEAFGDCVELFTVIIDSAVICEQIKDVNSCGQICKSATTVKVKSDVLYAVGTYIAGNNYTKESSVPDADGYYIYKKN